jgi:fructosamine-3-kinase
MIVIKCDGLNCKSENHDINVPNWLTVGSSDGHSLTMKNQLPKNQFSIMSNYGDLHFCSQHCFMTKFFEVELPGGTQP